MSRRRSRIDNLPTVVSIRRNGLQVVATANVSASAFGRTQVRGDGLNELGALKNLYRNWSLHVKGFDRDGPRMRVIPPETAAAHHIAAGTLAAEFDAVFLGAGIQDNHPLLVRVNPEGMLDVSIKAWEKNFILVDGRKISFERRRLVKLAGGRVPEQTIRRLWSYGGCAREKKLLELSRRAVARSMPRSREFPALGRDQQWDAEGVSFVLPLNAGEMPWSRALRIRFCHDGTSGICRLGYRLPLSRTDRDRACVVPRASPWTIVTTHGLDLHEIRKERPQKRFEVLRREFWSSVNLALADPFVHPDLPLVTAPPAHLPEDLAARIDSAVEDLVLVRCPYRTREIIVRFMIQFLPEPRIDWLSASSDAAAVWPEIKQLVEDILHEAQPAPTGRFVPRDDSRPRNRLSEWCRTTETHAVIVSTDVTAHRRLLAERRLAARIQKEKPTPPIDPVVEFMKKTRGDLSDLPDIGF